ncbi:hypothetical protein ACHAQA_006775 [Verticillium albo-atrum]
MAQLDLTPGDLPIPPPVPANTPTGMPKDCLPPTDTDLEAGDLTLPQGLIHQARAITFPGLDSETMDSKPDQLPLDRSQLNGDGYSLRKNSTLESYDAKVAVADVPIPHPTGRKPWQRPVMLLCLFYVVGLGTTLSHISYYVHLSGTVVGDGYLQQQNIRIGTALAVLTQFSFVTTVWFCYTQCLWRNLQRTSVSPQALNAAFSANESILSLRNTEMLRKFKLGSALALLAWCLLLPAFFTPSTLYILPDTDTSVAEQEVPQLAISNSSEGHRFAYSPPTQRNTTNYLDDNTRTFAGPRTALSLVSTAAAALGEILPLPAPHDHARYNISFFGPSVRCGPANATTEALIDAFLRQKMARPLGSAREVDNAYYAFVPVRAAATGALAAVARPRERAPSNATNEVWISFSRYVEGTGEGKLGLRPRARQRLVCEMYNASYELSMAWEHGVQSISGEARALERVGFPGAGEVGTASNMAQHAYAAFMWVITDQVVGSLSWYEDGTQEQEKEEGDLRPNFDDWSDAMPSASSRVMLTQADHGISEATKGGAQAPAPRAAQFGVIDTPLEHNVLLGCDDLDVFFDFSQRLYSFDHPRMDGLKEQRRRDKAMAGGLSLGELIQQLSFNVTVSLLQNDLMT